MAISKTTAAVLKREAAWDEMCKILEEEFGLDPKAKVDPHGPLSREEKVFGAIRKLMDTTEAATKTKIVEYIKEVI